MENISFGVCQICGQGQLFAVKDAIGGRLLVMCDDCESQWRSPDEARSYEHAMKEEVRVVLASIEEVKAAGWGKYLENRADL
jgi:hypothetical protein